MSCPYLRCYGTYKKSKIVAIEAGVNGTLLVKTTLRMSRNHMFRANPIDDSAQPISRISSLNTALNGYMCAERKSLPYKAEVQ